MQTTFNTDVMKLEEVTGVEKLPEINTNKQNPIYFLVKINFRQRTTIQGEVEWLNQPDKQVRHFRSLLELVSLISDALEIAGGSDSETPIKKWY